MTGRLVYRGLLLGLAVGCGLCRRGRAEERYWAQFADGTEVTASRIENWGTQSPPKINGRLLFDARNPVRLIRDTRLKPGLTGPRVVFANGDVLPGRATGLSAAEDYAGKPLCLAVAPQAPLRHAKGQSLTVLVRPECVQRVVLGQAPRGPYRPGTLLLASGEALLCQAVRWTRRGIQVLTDRGIRSFPLDDLAEIHMPARDATQHVLNDALAPCPQADSLVGRVTTAQGASLTFRQAMWVTQRYWLLVQPAWALHAIQVWLHDVCFLSFRRPYEVPLSLLPAETLAQRSFTGFVWHWQRNRNVRGELLASHGLSSDLGIGTHSYSAVAFRLPQGARSVSFLAGLDRAVADRGCVKLKVCRDSIGGRRLWQSGFLRGSDKPLRVGPLDCRKAKRLVLVTEFGHRGRPRGADPADIRDEVNWLLPTVRLDPAALKHYAGSPLRHCPPLAGWSLSKADAAGVSVGTKWDTRYHRWEPLLNVPASGLTLTRKVRISAATPFLWAGALTEDVNHTLSVRARGPTDPPAGRQVPCTDGAPHLEIAKYANSRWWALLPYVDKEVTLAVKIRAVQAAAKPTQLRHLTLRLRKDPTLAPTSERRPQEWRYTTTEPPRGWANLDFDDSAWKRGPGGFGTKGYKTVRTEWNTKSIWLRRTFEAEDARPRRLYLKVIHGGAGHVYINGQLAAKLDRRRDKYTVVSVAYKAAQAVKAGPNVLAVHCRNSQGQQLTDVGLEQR